MARYKPYNPDQSFLLPVTLKDHIYPGSLEETIDIMVEQNLDLTLFDQIYHNNDTGRLAYHPKILLKVILLSSSRGIIGSRRIEQACRENILFMALAGGHQPDHSTIAAFVTSMNDFTYDNKNDVYICPEGHLLELQTNHIVNRGTICRVFRIKDDSCQNCLIRDKCLGNKFAKP